MQCHAPPPKLVCVAYTVSSSEAPSLLLPPHTGLSKHHEPSPKGDDVPFDFDLSIFAPTYITIIWHISN